jgi:Zn-dependent protease
VDDSVTTLALGAVWFVAFLFSTTLHEASHAFVALRLGDPTAYHGGQVSLNPIPHIRREPIGMVIIPILSYATGGWMIGWASAPYDPQWAAQHPRRAGAMALAGPIANLSLVILAAIGIRVGMATGVFQPPPDGFTFTEIVLSPAGGALAGVAALVSVFFSLNLILFLFNLLPLPPMDGSGVLQLFLPEDVSRRWQLTMRHPMLGLLGLLVAWKFFGYLFRPVFVAALRLLFA